MRAGALVVGGRKLLGDGEALFVSVTGIGGIAALWCAVPQLR